MPDWIQCFLKARSLTKSIPQSAFYHPQQISICSEMMQPPVPFLGRIPFGLWGWGCGWSESWGSWGWRLVRPMLQTQLSSSCLGHPTCLGHRGAGLMQWISALCAQHFNMSVPPVGTTHFPRLENCLVSISCHPVFTWRKLIGMVMRGGCLNYLIFRGWLKGSGFSKLFSARISYLLLCNK